MEDILKLKVQAVCDPSLEKLIETLPTAIAKSKAPLKKYVYEWFQNLVAVDLCLSTNCSSRGR